MDDINVDIRRLDVSTTPTAGSGFADHLAAWSTFATAVLTALLVVAAFVAWHTAKKALKAAEKASEAAADASRAAEASNEQAKIDGIAQTRPYVYAEVIPSIGGDGSFDLRVRNVGKSAAREMTLAYDLWPETPDEIAQSLRTYFETPRTLPPGAEIRSYWRLVPNGEAKTFTDGTTEAGLGTGGKIFVHYTSDDPSHPRYEDEFDVMIDNSGMWPSGYSGPNARDGMTGDEKSFYKLGQALVNRISELKR